MRTAKSHFFLPTRNSGIAVHSNCVVSHVSDLLVETFKRELLFYLTYIETLSSCFLCELKGHCYSKFCLINSDRNELFQ